MSIILIQIDKSGSDILDKDYSIVLIKNKKEVYGINIPQKIKDSLLHSFNLGELNIDSKSHRKNKLRFKLRFHTAVVIELIRKAIKNNEVTIQLCNDFDRHFHEIKNMIYDHISKINCKLKQEDILLTKFQKPSFIDTAGKNIRNKDYKDYHIIQLDIDNLKKMIRK